MRDGKELTRCAASRNSTNYIALLESIEADNAMGDIFIITDNLSSHNSAQTRAWLAEHPRLHQVFIPDFRLLAQSARGLVAIVPSRCAFRVRVSPTLMRLSKPLASRPLNSTGEPNRGSGDVLPRIIAIIAVSFLIVFKERSTRRGICVNFNCPLPLNSHPRLRLDGEELLDNATMYSASTWDDLHQDVLLKKDNHSHATCSTASRAAAYSGSSL